MLTNQIPLGLLKRLFEESKGNLQFRNDLEVFLTRTLAIDGDKLLSLSIESKEFRIADYPNVEKQISNCLSHLKENETELFCEILLKHLKGLNIENETSSTPKLIAMIKKPLVALDAIHSLYAKNYMDILFLEDYKDYLRQKMKYKSIT